MPMLQSPVENPPNDVECIALVKPGSALARGQWWARCSIYKGLLPFILSPQLNLCTPQTPI